LELWQQPCWQQQLWQPLPQLQSGTFPFSPLFGHPDFALGSLSTKLGIYICEQQQSNTKEKTGCFCSKIATNQILIPKN
jgi:hypothetical protein